VTTGVRSRGAAGATSSDHEATGTGAATTGHGSTRVGHPAACATRSAPGVGMTSGRRSPTGFGTAPSGRASSPGARRLSRCGARAPAGSVIVVGITTARHEVGSSKEYHQARRVPSVHLSLQKRPAVPGGAGGSRFERTPWPSPRRGVLKTARRQRTHGLLRSVGGRGNVPESARSTWRRHGAGAGRQAASRPPSSDPVAVRQLPAVERAFAVAARSSTSLR
jgi:hypothetical protein